MSAPNGRQIPSLLFAGFWVYFVVSRAYERGDIEAYGFIKAMLIGCTTPGSILVFPVVGIWYWLVRTKKQ